MIFPFLHHHLERARRGEVTNVLQHCHVRGLWSLMLHDEPGNRVRLFYADESHELGPNAGVLALRPGEPMTLAIHAHHCDVTLVRVFGEVDNITVAVARDPDDGPLYRCMYESAITGEGGRLVNTGERFRYGMTELDQINRLGSQMTARTLHTIAVEAETEAAWLVFEGREDPAYVPECFTNNPVFDSSGMYLQRPEMAVSILESCAERCKP
jgi:hypothetical protein